MLKTKANFETKPVHDDIGWSIPSDSAQSLGNNSTYDYGVGSTEIQQENYVLPPPPEETAGTSLESDQAHTNNKLRRTMKSVRNWFKDTFTKKSSKRKYFCYLSIIYFFDHGH